MSVTSLVPEDRRDEGYRSSQTESAFLKRAVDRGRASSCPNCKGFYLVSSSTGRAFEMNCKSWSCPTCSRGRRAVAVELIEGGMFRARFRGEWVRFLTLTAPPEGMSMSELYAAWNRLRTTLRKSGELAQYCAVVEVGTKGRQVPHLHALTTGDYIPQKRLSSLAVKAGFGKVADIRAVRSDGDPTAVGYLTKQLAHDLVGYLAKGEAARMAAQVTTGTGAKRHQVRPLRLSRRWYPGGFKAAESTVIKRTAARLGLPDGPTDPGPWFTVVRRWDGDISVVSRPKARQGAAATGGARPSGATPTAAETTESRGKGGSA